MNLTPRLQELFSLARTDPKAAAKKLREVAARLISAAEAMERRDEELIRSTGGMADRVQIQVVGPGADGRETVLQSVDTAGVNHERPQPKTVP